MLWKTIFVLSIFSIWCYVCQQWYVCGIKQKCGQIAVSNAHQNAPTAPEQNRPLLFKWESSEPMLGKSFVQLKDSLIGALGDSSILQITGFTFETEKLAGDTAEMGRIRAKKVQHLFESEFPSNRIKLHTKMLQPIEGMASHPFESVSFKIITPRQLINQNKLILEKRKLAILFLDRPGVYDGQEIIHRDIENYLADLAERLDRTREKIKITGHAENEGDANYNFQLGLRNAETIRDILVGYGVKTGNIAVTSKGASEPLTENDGFENRNIRVEIKFP